MAPVALLEGLTREICEPSMQTARFAPRTKHEDRTRTTLYLAMEHEGEITFRASKTWQAPLHTYVKDEQVPLIGNREDVNSRRSARRIPWTALGAFALSIRHTKETMDVPRVVIPILGCVSVASIKLRSLETALSTSKIDVQTEKMLFWLDS
jgi:hypothetical protein